MRIYGYHRTSTREQHLDRGIKSIKDFCQERNYILDEIFTDQQTGKNFDRPDYIVLKRMAKKGDIIIISELDRLGRNKELTLKELRYFKDNGIRVMILELPTTLVDYSKLGNEMASMMMETINNMLIEMYASFAHAEMTKRAERQKQGIEAMKERGGFDNYGRPKAMDYNKFVKEYQKVIDGAVKPFELMKELGLTRSTFYRYKKQYENEGK